MRARHKCVSGSPLVEAGENLCFPLEPSEAIRIGRKRLGQDLQRHLPVQLGVGRLIDLAHPALADEGGHLVMAESGADVQRHGCESTSRFSDIIANIASRHT